MPVVSRLDLAKNLSLSHAAEFHTSILERWIVAQVSVITEDMHHAGGVPIARGSFGPPERSPPLAVRFARWMSLPGIEEE